DSGYRSWFGFCQAEDGIRDRNVTGVQTCALPILVQPAAMAGPILRVPIASGKFHGVMRMQGPTGSRETMTRVLPSADWAYSPSKRTASSENQRKNSAP